MTITVGLYGYIKTSTRGDTLFSVKSSLGGRVLFHCKSLLYKLNTKMYILGSEINPDVGLDGAPVRPNRTGMRLVPGRTMIRLTFVF